MNNTITFEKLLSDLRGTVASMMSIDKSESNEPISKVMESLKATKNSKEINFKKYKYRSKRLHKKLFKKFDGYEFKQEPAILIYGDMYIAHPALAQELYRILNKYHA